MTTKETGGPAFPSGLANLPNGEFIHPEAGMTLRQYAAIKLRVPNSGTGWLDEMITKSLSLEFAGRALQGVVTHGRYTVGMGERHEYQQYADKAAAIANAMLRALK